MTTNLTFLKLGGSLITNKDIPYTLATDHLHRIAGEISEYLNAHPEKRLIIGHGSGSYAHTSASQYKTRQGVYTPEDWTGFSSVCKDARSLNQIVLDTLIQAGISAVSFPPSTQVLCANHKIVSWDTTLIQNTLDSGLVPIVFGDTVFDTKIGGTILSTEELFAHLVSIFHPYQILLAGVEPGLWANFPDRDQIIQRITPNSYANSPIRALGSASNDVTGGMAAKVSGMLSLVNLNPGLIVQVFSGTPLGSISQALNNIHVGTMICSDREV